MTALPKWLLITLHVLILTVTGLAALTQIPSVFAGLGLPVEAHYATLVVTYAGLAVVYVLRSPFVLGWLSTHDPDDVITAEQGRKQAIVQKKLDAALPKVVSEDEEKTPPAPPFHG